MDLKELENTINNSKEMKELIIGIDARFLEKGYGGLPFIMINFEKNEITLTTDGTDYVMTTIEDMMDEISNEFKIFEFRIMMHNSKNGNDKDLIFKVENREEMAKVITFVLSKSNTDLTWVYR